MAVHGFNWFFNVRLDGCKTSRYICMDIYRKVLFSYMTVSGFSHNS